jgi:hypothetical protein
MNNRGALRFGESVARFLGHATAIIVGLVLMIVGLGLGVTLVALPVGIVAGLCGVLLFLWGLFGYSTEKQT